jgi:Fe-S oxidoreductase
VPAFRSKFFELYYGRYLRPVRDYVVGAIEHLVPWMARMPDLSNALAARGPGRAVLRAIGLVATPPLSGLDIAAEMKKRGVGLATPEALQALTPAERERSVVVVQDAFTSYYETPLLLDLVDLIQALGVRPWLAPYRPNGKALHVHGFLGAFGRVAAANAAMLEKLASTGVDLIGIDPSMTLTYRAEYADALGGQPPRVQLVQEWLAARVDTPAQVPEGHEYRLLPHCTERTTAPAALKAWKTAFDKAGLGLTILPSGCCGMAGTWGHEAEHRATSEHIYALSWARHVAAAGGSGTLLADGYSCRSQAKLIDGAKLLHPVQALLAAIRGSKNMAGRPDSTAQRINTSGPHQAHAGSEAA